MQNNAAVIQKPPFRPLRALRRLVLVLLLCTAVGLVCFFAGRAGDAPHQATQVNAAVLETQLHEISELASVSWAYTNMAQFENSNVFYGVTLPLTTKRFILTYDGEIKAGIALGDATVTVAEPVVTVRLPKAQILSHTIDERSIEVFDEKTSIFNPFTVEDFSTFQADQKAAMEQKALERGLLTEAAAKAQSSVRLLLGAALPQGWELKVE